MSSSSLADPVHPSPDRDIATPTAIERDLIDFFVHAALSLGLPRSVGTLYGYLYFSEHPQPFDAIAGQLQISRGSASQGLRLLESLHAVHRVFVPGDRRTFYRAEISLRNLVGGLLANKVDAHLQSSEERLELLTSQLGESEEEPGLANRRILRQRLEALKTWHQKARRFLPFLGRLSRRRP